MTSFAISIVGPTATGKTSLALALAKHLQADIISADSRQIFKYMDIGTGKDLPQGADFHCVDQMKLKGDAYDIGYYLVDGTPLWLYDVALPSQPFSAAHYYRAAKKTLEQTAKKGNTPIFVGGTGLYTRTAFHPPASLFIPPDYSLREALASFDTQELHQRLSTLDSKKAQAMNHSDFNNPRRLIRAIEVAKANTEPLKESSPQPLAKQVLKIGLKIESRKLDERIRERVKKRLEQGFIEEVEQLNQKYPHFSPQAKTALGYQQIARFLTDKTTLDQAVEEWVLGEQQYAKRQMTWFEKDEDIHWFNALSFSLKQDIVSLVTDMV